MTDSHDHEIEEKMKIVGDIIYQCLSGENVKNTNLIANPHVRFAFRFIEESDGNKIVDYALTSPGFANIGVGFNYGGCLGNVADLRKEEPDLIGEEFMDFIASKIHNQIIDMFKSYKVDSEFGNKVMKAQYQIAGAPFGGKENHIMIAEKFPVSEWFHYKFEHNSFFVHRIDEQKAS